MDNFIIAFYIVSWIVVITHNYQYFKGEDLTIPVAIKVLGLFGAIASLVGLLV